MTDPTVLLNRSDRVNSADELASLFASRMAAGPQGITRRTDDQTLKVRTLFLSDMHLGMPGTATKELVHLLEHCTCQNLVMVGDVIDGWALGRRWKWRARQEAALDAILAHAADPACDVTYIPGNHDEFWRTNMPSDPISGVRFQLNMLYDLADGRRFWITHGDEHDTVTSHATWLSQFGSMMYEGGIHASKGFKRLQQMVGLPGFSASKELKNLVKYIVQPPREFEAQLSADAKGKDAQGVFCGHIHRPELKKTESGITYANTGDFVESASAIVEDFDGTLSLIYWSHKTGLQKRLLEKE